MTARIRRWFYSAFPAISATTALLLTGSCGGADKDPTGPAAGSLSLVVSGLPAGTQARVHVAGPGGYAHDFTKSSQIMGLSVGGYTVTAQHVNAPGLLYTAAPSSSNVTVSAGQMASVTVTYAGSAPPTLNAQITGIQLLQSTQRSDGTVPMVAGRDVMLRVFVTASQANSVAPAVRVRLYHAGVQVDSMLVSAPGGGVPLAVDSATLSSSWNLIIPAARVTTGLGVVVVLDPADLIAESNESDNRFPASGTGAVDVRTVPAFNLRFVPVHQSANGVTGDVSNATKDAFADVTRRMWPLSQVNVDVAGTYTTTAPALQSNDGNGAWGQILNEMAALESADGGTRNYVAIVSTSYSSGIAGLGYIGAPASVAWDKAGSAPGVVAHELGHNFGRRHAPCGGPSGPDPNFPYANGGIGVWGFDQGDLTLKSPGTYKDVMSYCNPDWVSDYNYQAVMTYRGTSPAIGTPMPGLLVWGRIRQDSLILEPSFAVTAPARLPARGGSYRVSGSDASGAALFNLSFDGDLVADLPGGPERHFAFVVPFDAATGSRLTTVALRAGVRSVQRRASSGLRPAAVSAPTARRLSSGETELRWDPAYPMALVRDAATGDIVGFLRGGQARLATSNRNLLVTLSDGVGSQLHTVSVP